MKRVDSINRFLGCHTKGMEDFLSHKSMSCRFVTFNHLSQLNCIIMKNFICLFYMLFWADIVCPKQSCSKTLQSGTFKVQVKSK